MSNFVEQRSAIQFCLRNDISAAETYRMLQKAFGEETMSQKNVYKWYKDFKEGRERVDDLERFGRPSTSIDDRHMNKIKELVLANRRLTIRDLVDMVGISFGSVQAILKDHLGFRRLKSRLVPKFLNFFEKERRVKTCEAMLSDYQDVYKQIITGDETWVYVCVKLFAKRDRNYGPITLGFCNTIMRLRTQHWFFVSFSPKTLPMLLHNHRIRPT
ncbi:protein GVQW3-like [Hydra vulgaris]|uniref:Protein GVQW3-like n=1 Tax=Hydra vulgaris TaxID=6087 RepID=A0ABM4BMV2_HYDVU